MKIPKQIIPLSILLLFTVGIYSHLYRSSFSSDNNLMSEIQAGTNYGNQVSNTFMTDQKQFSEVTSGLTTLTSNADTYTPGDWVTITAESNTDEMNGSLEWRLESPIEEYSFDFNSFYQDVFSDPEFNNDLIPDWNNTGFDGFTANDGYLNLTEGFDNDTVDAVIFNNNSALISDTDYIISFDYYSQGENLLINPSFETGDLSGWDGQLTNITIVNDPLNTSHGDYYAEINATEGFVLNQTINGLTEGRTIFFTASATGNTQANYWFLQIEYFNVTGDLIGFKTSPEESLNKETDERGYVTLSMEATLPENTTDIKAIFVGRDAGADADEVYTGFLDNCILTEAPPALKFSHGTGGTWNDTTLTPENHQWANASIKIDTGLSLPSSTETMRFILSDSNTFANNKTSFWLIDNIAVNLVTKPEDTTGPFSGPSEDTITGFVNSTRFHKGFRENLSSTFNIHVEAATNISVASESSATIQIQLPTYQVYLGEWIFVFMIHQIDNDVEFLQTKTIYLSFVVEEQVNFIVQDYYMLRGSTNKTVGNESVFTEYFDEKKSISAFSPGDNVTVLGYLEANSTQGIWYDTDYLRIGSASTNFRWESSWESKEVISWSSFGYIPYYEDGSTVIDGNFTTPFNNTQSFAFNFVVPTRGIFGNFSANLTMSITATNTKLDGTGGTPLLFEIPLDLPSIQFKVNVTKENLPGTSFWLTDYIGGNVSIEFLNINDTLETNFPGRNISSLIDIPIADIDLSIFIDEDENPDIQLDQEFHYNHIGNTIIWLDFIDPHLTSGDYNFLIRWNTPFRQNETDFALIGISNLTISVQGTLEVIPLTEIPTFKQGDQESLNFSIRLNERTEMRIGGLDLYGSFAENVSMGNIVVYEKQGVYFLDLDIKSDMTVGTYNIEIFVVGQTEYIGSISFQVEERIVEQTDRIQPLDIAISIGGFAIFIILGVAIIGLMYRINSKD
ncbi:MAG: hypothetical protein ACW97P_04880 [Candidatus Hodarchaeales archaeon]|jgi:hypothetical protein